MPGEALPAARALLAPLSLAPLLPRKVQTPPEFPVHAAAALVGPPCRPSTPCLRAARRRSAPEVLTGQPCGIAADIYSFGITLWWVRAGGACTRKAGVALPGHRATGLLRPLCFRPLAAEQLRRLRLPRCVIIISTLYLFLLQGDSDRGDPQPRHDAQPRGACRVPAGATRCKAQAGAAPACLAMQNPAAAMA